MLEFPENPTKAFWFESVPKANGAPAKLKPLAALTVR
jgi:hypothetical protein